MGTLDLGMDDEAEEERRRLEEERRARRAAEGLETAQEGDDDLREARRAALRDLSGMPEPGTHARAMEDVERDQGPVRAEAAPPPPVAPAGQGHQMTRAPVFTPEERERIGGVEARLRAGDRAGVERDTMQAQRGAAAPVRDAESEFLDEPRQVAPQAPTAPRPGIARPVERASGLNSPVVAAQRAKPAAPPPSERLDAGLPSEADIGRARTEDDWRRIARGILGAIGQMYTHRPLPEMQSRADALQQRRDAGLRERMGQKREDVERQDAAALRTAQMDAQQQDRAQQRQIQESQVDIARRRLGLSERQMESELAESERARASDAEMDDAASAASQRERAALAVRLSQISPAQRSEALAQIGGSEGITSLTGREARAIVEQLARPVQPRGTALGRSGGPSPRRAAAIERLRADAVAAGVPESVAQTADARTLEREILARSRPQRGRGGAGASPDRHEILPGVTVDPGMVDQVTYRRHREGLIAGRRAGDSLREIRGVAQRFGVRAIVDPRARAELAAPLQRMLTRISQMRNSGVIQPSELPTIEAFLPDPSSGRQITIGEFNARMGSFLRDIDADVIATLEADGTSPEEIQTALRYIHGEGGGSRGGGGRTTAPAQARRDAEGNVVMYGPDGPRRVPPEMVEQREAMGWTYEPQGGR